MMRKKICLSLLLPEGRIQRPLWTEKKTVTKKFGDKKALLCHWNDLCFIAEKDFFEELNYSIDRIPISRWSKDPNLSSGVGYNISTRLKQLKRNMYVMPETMVSHSDHTSVMNTEERTINPLICEIKEKVNVGIATIPERITELKKAINSIIDQVDHVHVFLNNYNTVPAFLKNIKITVYDNKNDDFGDAGKFYWIDKIDGYYITIDDDLLYPSDYIQNLISKIEQYKRKAIISYHGRILKKTPISSYYKDKVNIFHCLHKVQKDEKVHLGGTGVMGFHTSTLKLNISDFELPNMADIWLAKKAHKARVPIICAEHSNNWIQYQETMHEKETIFDKHKNDDSIQTSIVNSLNWSDINN